MMSIEQEQQGVADNAFAAFIHLVDRVAGEPYAQAAHKACVPGIVSHFLAGGLEPGNILDVGAAEAAALKEFPPLQNGLGPGQSHHLPGKSKEVLLLLV